MTAFFPVSVAGVLPAAGVFLLIVKPYNALRARMKAEAEASPTPAAFETGLSEQEFFDLLDYLRNPGS